MVIFNSYVKLPEGISKVDAHERSSFTHDLPHFETATHITLWLWLT